VLKKNHLLKDNLGKHIYMLPYYLLLMEIITKQDFLINLDSFINRIKAGEIFIYPTDTIYGIGCDATNDVAVEKIKQIKKRTPGKFFSVIAPNEKWIYDNFEVNNKNWIDKLPDAYTFILKIKNKTCISKEVNDNNETLGVRIPKHWFSGFIEMLKLPVVSTSANVSGEPVMTSIEDLDEDLKQHIDFFLDDGIKKGNPSTIVDLTSDTPSIIER